MAATRDSRLKAIVLVAPRVRSDYPILLGEGVLWTPLRIALERQKAALEAWDTTPTNLTLSQPVIPKENILFIQGRNDLLATPECTEELWQKWKQPEIWWLPHGHISLVGVPGLTGRVLRWLSPRLNATTAQARPTDATRKCRVRETKMGDFFGFQRNQPLTRHYSKLGTIPKNTFLTPNVHQRETLMCGNLIGLPKIQDLTPEFFRRFHN